MSRNSRSREGYTYQHSTNIKEPNAKIRTQPRASTPFKRAGLQNEHVRFYQNTDKLQISHWVHQKSRKMPSKEHKITRSSFKRVRIEKYITQWLL